MSALSFRYHIGLLLSIEIRDISVNLDALRSFSFVGDGMPDYFERGYDLILSKTKIMRRNFLHQNFMEYFDSI
jgi:hypothetical protein